MVDITAASLSQDIAQTQANSQKLSQDFDDFLVLLTTQLQNQDPLSPMDSTEFTNQLVGFSQVEQQINSNQKLEQLLGLQLASASTVSLGYVGMDVNFIGNETYFDGTHEPEIFYVLDETAAQSTIRITNSSGETVRTLNAEGNAGQHNITWDGKDDNGTTVPEGEYRIIVDALDSDGNAINTSTAVPGYVQGIEAKNGVTYLRLQGDTLISVNAVLSATERKD